MLAEDNVKATKGLTCTWNTCHKQNDFFLLRRSTRESTKYGISGDTQIVSISPGRGNVGDTIARE